MPKPDARPGARNDRQRPRDAVFVLTFFGIMLLTPPFLNLFSGGRLLSGIPMEVIWLFAIWLGLVAGSFWLSSYLAPAPPASTGDSAADQRDLPQAGGR